jgi:hypothetical protein
MTVMHDTRSLSRSGEETCALETEARRLARRLALREADAFADACRAAGGGDGAALAWAIVDMIRDWGVPLHVLPLAEAAALLSAQPESSEHGARATLAALVATLETLSDADLLGGDAPSDGERGSPDMGAAA